MNQAQPTQTMSPTTSKSLLSEELKKNSSKGLSRQALNEFLDSVSDALIKGPPDPEEDDMPYVEASREIIDHYNKHNIKGFDGGPLYFIFNGVKVYEEGRRMEALKRNRVTIEDKIFGKSKVG